MNTLKDTTIKMSKLQTKGKELLQVKMRMTTKKKRDRSTDNINIYLSQVKFVIVLFLLIDQSSSPIGTLVIQSSCINLKRLSVIATLYGVGLRSRL